MDTPLFATRHFTPRTGARALVLGGGGATGNAWVIGLLAGLGDAGLDVTTPDLTVGTSAGSTTAAQLAGASPAELFAATIGDGGPAAPPRRTAPVVGAAPPVAAGATPNPLERLLGIIDSAADLTDLRRRIGAAALEAEAASDGSWQARWRATVASRLPDRRWPQRLLLVTAVDAGTGDPVVFDRDSGVDLVDAVAASCAGGGLPYRIGGVSYVDGGYRASAENADLAMGHARVLVLSPLGGRTLHPRHWRTGLAVQVDALRTAGSQVETIVPEPGAEHMFGPRSMDLSLRPAAARAGYDQGRALAARLTDLWA